MNTMVACERNLTFYFKSFWVFTSSLFYDSFFLWFFGKKRNEGIKRKRIKRQMFCIKYIEMHTNTQPKRIRCVYLKKNQRTHSSWQRVVKCSPVIYFVFINLLIYFACCQSLIFVSLRWTSSCYFWPLCINVKRPK